MPANATRIVQFPANRASFDQAKGRKPINQRRPWIRVVILVCLFAYLVLAGAQLAKQEMRMRQLMQSYQRLQETQVELQATNQSLQSQINGLTANSAYLEQLARQMGMVKSSDTIYLPTDADR